MPATPLLVRIDGQPVEPETLWWPAMNFGQFRWEAPLGRYELALARSELAKRLAKAYATCVGELQVDDLRFPEEGSPLRDAGYPPLDTLLDHPAASLDVLGGYLREELLAAFLPTPPTEEARFMVNSIDQIRSVDPIGSAGSEPAKPARIVLHGRGYWGAPGFAVHG